MTALASPARHAATRPESLRAGACVTLALLSGLTDAVGFLALGGTFTSVMTGNMVLAGVGLGAHDLHRVGSAAAAIGAYVLGVYTGTACGRTVPADGRVWPARVTRILQFELLVLAAAAVVWWTHGSTPAGDLRTVLLVLDAVALGVQSSAVARFEVGGLSTTYLTGTLTTMAVGLANRTGVRNAWSQLRLLLGLVAGAVLGALAAGHAVVLVPAAQLVLVVAVLFAGRAARVGAVGP